MSETGCEQAGSEEKRGWFGRLKAGLSRSAGQLGSSIGALFTKRRLDQDALDELEETLIQADLGIPPAGTITYPSAKNSLEKANTTDVRRAPLAKSRDTSTRPLSQTQHTGAPDHH